MPLRLVTYNVHACRGNDGRLSVDRVARVLAELEPDLVALQEIDVGRRRSSGLDQAQELAERLSMVGHFGAALQLKEGRYGNAILSRLPLRVRRSAPLPRPRGLPVETRAALWVEVELEATVRLQLINTHLGLLRFERLKQTDALLGPDWLGDCRGPTILCGDFNATPGSTEHALLAARLFDGVRAGTGATFWGPAPLWRIDHVFCSEQVSVLSSQVHRSPLARVASDHLPLVVDFACPSLLTVEATGSPQRAEPT